jgi:hypothetical protein
MGLGQDIRREHVHKVCFLSLLGEGFVWGHAYRSECPPWSDTVVWYENALFTDLGECLN